MNTSGLKLSLLTYVKHLGLYDYLAFGWLLITFLVLIFLAILIAKKSSALSLVVIVLALIFFVVSPFLIKMKLNETLRTTTTEITLLKKLTFSSSLILEANIYNQSDKNFTMCVVHSAILKNTNAEGFKAYINTLKPIAKRSIIVQQDLPKEGVIEYKMVFDDFEYSGDVNATVKAECY